VEPARPDAAWYAKQAAEATDPDQVKQEYPATAAEAFVVSGRVRFRPEWIEAQAAHTEAGLPETAWPPSLRGLDSLAVYRPPHPGGSTSQRVMIAADVAEGLEHGDYSDAVALDARTWEELAAARPLGAGRVRPPAARPGRSLRRRDHRRAEQPRARGHQHAQGPRIDADRPGARRQGRVADQRADEAADHRRPGRGAAGRADRDPHQAALDELQVYTVGPDGKTTAPEGYHDDRVMSRAIGVGWIQMVGGTTGFTMTNPLAGYRG
jgi:hypothetical protein